ncbi:DNA-binding protein [Nanobdella aerobiophila]|uniref:DNA-binding protein n=1 Tax=Nanobdella aerobiophila TaxID=2586965 RepID=A0A915ST29_9ARCH|nr:HEPN domain-containing protein [Nanobdella aerobiophila]BBL45831.1 DNA-binding protein [Nanobdella aerobiophila]
MFLEENAKYFEEKAKEAYKEGKYKFTLFFTEQALQLYLKYILYKKFEEYPKTHKLKELFEISKNINSKFIDFYNENSDVIDLIEEAYITSRYLDKEYSEKSAKKSIELINKFKEEFKEWIK